MENCTGGECVDWGAKMGSEKDWTAGAIGDGTCIPGTV